MAPLPEFAVIAAAHELQERLSVTAPHVDCAELAEAVLRAALPHMASPRLRLEARAALLEEFVTAMQEDSPPDLAELAEDAYNVVEPFLRGCPPPFVYEVWWTSGHHEYVEAHYVAYEGDTVRFNRETDDSGYQMVLDVIRKDVRTIRRLPADGEPIPVTPDEDDEGGALA